FSDPIKQMFHGSTETDFTDAILEIVCAAEDFDFDSHEINRQIAPIDFRKADGVLLSGNDGIRLALFAPVNHIKNFLLGEPVMVGELFGINQIGSEGHQALLEAHRLGDPAERGDLPPFDPFQPSALAGEDVLEIKRMMDAFDDPGAWVELSYAATQFMSVPIAFSDENRAGPREMGRGLPQGAAWQQAFIAKRLLAINQNNVEASAMQ